MAMSKKDYEALAACFADIAGAAMTHREKQLVCRLATMIHNRVRQKNVMFNGEKFLAACKLPKVEGFNC